MKVRNLAAAHPGLRWKLGWLRSPALL